MKRLTHERERRGWTKFRLGSESGVHPSLLGQIESGRYEPYPVQLAKLARALEFEEEPEALLREVPG